MVSEQVQALVQNVHPGTGDEKLKKSLQVYAYALSKVNQLDIHTYEFIDSGDAQNMNLPSVRQIGFTAQEIIEQLRERIEVHENRFVS